MAKKNPGGRPTAAGKVVSVRFTDAALHLRGRHFALAHGQTFGELLSAALLEYLKKRGA